MENHTVYCKLTNVDEQKMDVAEFGIFTNHTNISDDELRLIDNLASFLAFYFFPKNNI